MKTVEFVRNFSVVSLNSYLIGSLSLDSGDTIFDTYRSENYCWHIVLW